MSQFVQVIHTVAAMRRIRSTLSEPVGFVPTMGMLHEGHKSLIRLASHQTSSIIVSIYANPSQLAPSEDETSYPSVLESDMSELSTLDEEFCCNSLGRIKAAFVPKDRDMYPSGHPGKIASGIGSSVNVLPLSKLLEGALNPAHFVGVATVCLKFFIVLRPGKVYLGEKDLQQSLIVKWLVLDFPGGYGSNCWAHNQGS